MYSRDGTSPAVYIQVLVYIHVEVYTYMCTSIEAANTILLIHHHDSFRNSGIYLPKWIGTYNWYIHVHKHNTRSKYYFGFSLPDEACSDDVQWMRDNWGHTSCNCAPTEVDYCVIYDKPVVRTSPAYIKPFQQCKLLCWSVCTYMCTWPGMVILL